jgi:hypothetical protein
MLRLAIVDSDGKQVDPKEISSGVDLVSIAEQARTLIRDCEQLAHAKRNPQSTPAARVPYST